MQRIAILCVALLLSASVLAAKPKLTIDGEVDEAAWAKAQVFRDFVVVEPYTLAQPSHPTEALLLSTPEGIAIAFRCSQPAGVPRLQSLTPRDADIPGDRVNVFIDFNGDGETAYNFTIALSGAIQDATITNENYYSPDWDGDWKHAVAETDTGWSAEFLIPWTVASMKGSGAPKRTIALMFDRVLGHSSERSGFPVASFRRPRFVSEFSKVEIEQYQASIFQVFPYVSTNYDFVGDAGDAKAGADLYWKPSGDLQLTAALNPDFGQVEADELVVNFDAIETFFSDKRPFFTENQGLFDLRTPDSGLLIYTRRIGGPRDDDGAGAAEIDVALKLNGSALGFDYGVMTAQESQYASDIGSLFYAQRLLRTGENFSVGYLGTWTDRPFLQREALVNAVDGNWRVNEHWALTGQTILSGIDESGSDKDGAGAWTRIDYTPNAAWRQELELTHFDGQLDFNDMGYQRRASLNEAEWTIENQQTVADEASSMRGKVWRLELQARSNDSGDRLPDVLVLDHTLQFRDGSEVLLDFYRESSGYNDLISRGNGLVRLPARNQYYAEYESRRIGRWQFELAGRIFQEGLDGYAREARTELAFFASDTLTADGSLSWIDSDDWLIWEQDTLFARFERQQLTTEVNLNWFPAPHHEVRVKLQWLALAAQDARSERITAGGDLQPSTDVIEDFTVNNLGVQIRYRWEFAPQSDFYVVYGRGGFVELQDDRSDFGELLDEALSLRDSDQLLVKVRKRF
ncbi:MAG TPA: DUF5916 domain-containing protein [Xanthomonadales bacterium]|nr:DUF5916 domain-containing protein [Xanthomonadales bacterium]